MFSPTIGIQIYTLRDFCQTARGFDGVLGFLSSLGVKDVQISAIGPIPPEEQKQILKKNNINVCVTHSPFDRIINETDKLIEEHKIIGCSAIGLGSMGGEFRKTKENVDRFISSVSSISDKLKANGMTFNYHNHDFEFETLDTGVTLMDYLIENTDPEYFYFIPDIAWILAAGKDPVEYLKKMKGRVNVCHFKDYTISDGKIKFCTLGLGLVDIKACYKVCSELNIPYIVYEQDRDWIDNDAKKATELSWEFLNSIAKTQQERLTSPV